MGDEYSSTTWRYTCCIQLPCSIWISEHAQTIQACHFNCHGLYWYVCCYWNIVMLWNEGPPMYDMSIQYAHTISCENVHILFSSDVHEWHPTDYQNLPFKPTNFAMPWWVFNIATPPMIKLIIFMHIPTCYPPFEISRDYCSEFNSNVFVIAKWKWMTKRKQRKFIIARCVQGVFQGLMGAILFETTLTAEINTLQSSILDYLPIPFIS